MPELTGVEPNPLLSRALAYRQRLLAVASLSTVTKPRAVCVIIKCFLFEINHRTSSRKLGLGTAVAVNGHLDSPSSWPPWAPVIERFYRTQATPLPLN